MPDIILASASLARKTILHNAGVDCLVIPAGVDEGGLKRQMIETNRSPQEIAVALAALKARTVSEQEDEAYVIGADQILTCVGQFYSKVSTLDEAADTLERLNGQIHTLTSGYSVFRNGQLIADGADEADLKMRSLSSAHIRRYLDIVGNGILTSVGCYHYEGIGSQLFDWVKGDHSTILGLPLLPILSVLRAQSLLKI